jgi:hypothetical protein
MGSRKATVAKIIDLFGRCPILSIPKTAGESALLVHEFTLRETRLFQAMDLGVAQVSLHSDLSVFHQIAVMVGRVHRLNAHESVAFLSRAVFNRFE